MKRVRCRCIFNKQKGGIFCFHQLFVGWVFSSSTRVGGKNNKFLDHPLETWMDTIRSWSETLDDDIVRLKWLAEMNRCWRWRKFSPSLFCGWWQLQIYSMLNPNLGERIHPIWWLHIFQMGGKKPPTRFWVVDAFFWNFWSVLSSELNFEWFDPMVFQSL